jgi:hypothetical protein
LRRLSARQIFIFFVTTLIYSRSSWADGENDRISTVSSDSAALALMWMIFLKSGGGGTGCENWRRRVPAEVA